MALYGFKDRQTAERCKQLAETLHRTTESYALPTSLDNGSRIFIVHLMSSLPAATISNGLLRPSSGEATVYHLTPESQSSDTNFVAKPRSDAASPLKSTVYNITYHPLPTDENTFYLAVEDSFGKLTVVAQDVQYGVLREAMDHFAEIGESTYVVDLQADDGGTREVEVKPSGMVENTPGFAWNLPAGTPVKVENGQIVETFWPELSGNVTTQGAVENREYTVDLGEDGKFNGSATLQAFPAPNIPQ